jgi:hypothetical protein
MRISSRNFILPSVKLALPVAIGVLPLLRNSYGNDWMIVVFMVRANLRGGTYLNDVPMSKCQQQKPIGTTVDRCCTSNPEIVDNTTAFAYRLIIYINSIQSKALVQHSLITIFGRCLPQ